MDLGHVEVEARSGGRALEACSRSSRTSPSWKNREPDRESVGRSARSSSLERDGSRPNRHRSGDQDAAPRSRDRRRPSLEIGDRDASPGAVCERRDRFDCTRHLRSRRRHAELRAHAADVVERAAAGGGVLGRQHALEQLVERARAEIAEPPLAHDPVDQRGERARASRSRLRWRCPSPTRAGGTRGRPPRPPAARRCPRTPTSTCGSRAR